MEKNEQETIILINEGDMAEGFFRVSTTRENVFNRIEKRVDDDFHTPVEISYDIKGRPCCWIMKIPKKYLSKRTFGIGKPRKVSEEQRERMRAMAALRNASVEVTSERPSSN